MKTKFFIIALTFLCVSLSCNAQFYIVEDFVDCESCKVQETPVWCWAACIQMTLHSQDVFWSQRDIVNYVKGGLKFETAQAYEVSQFFNGIKIDYDGRTWITSCEYKAKAPHVKRFVNSIKEGVPVIVSYRNGIMEHAILVYAANIVDKPRKRLHSVYYFDPYTGKKNAMSGRDFYKYVTGSWIVKVYKN
ncbi:papain-like cysteine protease family protein [Marinifilum flexuosum]|uniref:papain-like cysteine protease family protein n=1 Tax=Marinifilum flexuosum TaxID=1117708 RepID=UPI0024936C89|nr:papain-like cysteine protease family protein [Marinifilum flexuosum]